jgi:hypothetical protein
MESTSTPSEATPTSSQDTSLPGDATVLGVFGSLDQATDAVTRLAEAGFPTERVSVVGQNLQSELKMHGFVTTGEVAKQGAKWGAVFGGLFGLLFGAAFLAIPGFGPLIILGPLAAAVVGAAEGAVGTGLVGAILGAFLSRQHIPKIEQHLRAGRYLVLVHGSAEEVSRAQEILRNAGSIEVSQHDHREAAAAVGSTA